MWQSSNAAATHGALLLVAIASACRPAPRPAASGQQTGEVLFSESPNVWYEEYYTAAYVSPDGQSAIYAGPSRFRLLDLESGREATERVWAGVTELGGAAFGPGGKLILLGSRGGQRGWFAREGDVPKLLPLPVDASPKWSPDGARVAFSRSGATDSVFEGPLGKVRGYQMPGGVADFAWLPNGGSLAVLTNKQNGTSSISLLDLDTGDSKIVANDLDAPTLFASRVAVAPQGTRAYVALASSGAPAPEERHRPHAKRQLGIYEVDLTTGARHPVVAATGRGDAFAPSVASGSLYWTYTSTDVSVVTLPASGGDARPVVPGGQIPSWRPDSRQIGYVYGDWRWADWGLNLDGGAIQVDTIGQPIDQPIAMITGYHEDFQPVWSPRGGWVAYHSHRTKTAVASFLAPATDDIWLRRVGAPARDTAEIRLTDFGLETGSPDWSRDGTQLLFVSFEEGDHGGAATPFVVTIDTLTGKAIRRARLPTPKEIQNVVWAAWSPVSDEVALESDRGGGRHSLWVVGSSGASARKLLDYPMQTYGGVSWAPDGRTLVFSALTDGRMQLFAIQASGGEPLQLTRDSANLFTPRTSPNGRLIAATRVSHRKEVRRLPLPR